MTSCPSCAASLPDAAAFCPSCGTPTSGPSQALTRSAALPPAGRPPRPIDTAPPAPFAEGFAPGHIVADRYRVIGLLGRGGMGEVYRADDLKLGQPVALKFLPRSLEADPRALERFHDEVRHARQVSHPHVCRIHDIDEVDGRHFLTMEYVDGEDLATLLRRIGRLPEAKGLEIARQVCAGLQAAHDRHVVHRDLKPGNVMIDGHGRARIADFGLAVSESAVAGEVAGTPAYMAPEQLRGEPATVRTDIYALGLLIYETCTGKRPFTATTFVEWHRAHTEDVPTSPSLHARDVDPVLERIILRCLEKDPSKRPSSAAQVALALPGGDPLAAALAGGETPSPDMVAAVRTEGALRPAAAFASLAAIVLLLAILSGASQPNLHRMVPFERSSEALADRASTLISQLGHGGSGVDRAWAFDLDQSYMAWDGDPRSGMTRWDRLRAGQPLSFYFWYRQSPSDLLPRAPGGRITLDDPPPSVEGMASVITDPLGRLVEFKAVPPAFSATAAAVPGDAWATLFAAAGLDPSRFEPADPRWTPPTFADERLAWTGALADHADLPVRIEAASYRGRPVFFRVAAPWDRPPMQAPESLERAEIAAALIAAGVAATVLVGAAILARRNLRLQRGDRRGTRRLAAVVAALVVVGAMLNSDQPVTLAGVATLLVASIQAGLLTASLIGITYLALEPPVRRHRPQLIVSWSRLLAGRLRDPLVARDVLLGVLLGLGGASVLWLAGWLKVWTSHPLPPNHYVLPDTMNGLGQAFGFALWTVAISVWLPFAILVFLALVRRVVLREWMAAILLGLALSVVEILLYARSWPAVVATLLGWAFTIGTVARFGLVAGVAGNLAWGLVTRFPVTSSVSAPYAPAAFMSLALVTALAVYGFWGSLGGQPLLDGDD